MPLKTPEEWIKQADYDLETAKALLKSGRYIYTIFMCHLSIEKALKGLYTKKLIEEPPKIHSLVYLATKIGLEPPDKFKEFIENLNRLSVPTRYPDELEKMLKEYDKIRTEEILLRTGELLGWLKER